MLHSRQMNTKNSLRVFFRAAAILVSLCALSHASDPKTIETDWTWDTYSSSFTSAATKTIDPAGFGSAGFSRSGGNIIGRSFAIYGKNGDFTFQVAHTTKTFPVTATNPFPATNQVPGGWYGSAPSISTSSWVSVPQNVPYNGKFDSLTTNPIFYFNNLSTSATYFIYIEIGRQKYK